MKVRRKVKSTIFIILTFMMVFASLPFHQSFAQELNTIKIKVDGSFLESDQPPIMVNDRVLVPLRLVFNALYADVEWIEETQTVIATKRLQTISLSIGSNEMYLNGEAIPLDSPAILVNDRTMVPVRAVSEGLGAEVIWNGETKTVGVASAQQDHYISDHYITEIIKSDDGQCELLKISVSYPQIRNDENKVYIDELNVKLKADAQNSFENLREEYGKNLEDIAREEFYDIPYEVTQKFDITCDKNDILSIIEMFIWWTGGAHPNSMKTSVTYDLQSGKELSLTDIFNKSQSEINTMVVETFTKLINENPEYYFEDAKDTILKEVENIGFYLNEGGIIFYFNPYTIAPYVAGYPSVTLSFDKEHGFFERFIFLDEFTTLRVATNAEFPPFEYIDEEGNIVGLDVDVDVIESINIDNGFGIATQKGSPFTQQIEEILNQMKADGTLESIIEKYIPILEK